MGSASPTDEGTARQPTDSAGSPFTSGGKFAETAEFRAAFDPHNWIRNAGCRHRGSHHPPATGDGRP